MRREDLVLLSCILNDSFDWYKYCLMYLDSTPKEFEHTVLNWLTDWLNKHMEQSPSWEANSSSASQEIPHILWNLKVHYCIHKCPPPVPNLSQLDPVHAPTTHLLNIHLNINLQSTPGSSKWSLSSVFPTKTLYMPLLYTCYMPRPADSSRFYHPNNIWWAVRIIKLLIM